MESRKIQFTGKSTYVVSLPKGWVTKKNLTAGDIIYIEEEEDGSLALSTIGTARSRTVTRILDITDKSPNEIKRNIVGQYIKGFDVLEITCKSRMKPQQKNAINMILKRLIGPEVLEETLNKIIINDLLDMSDLSPRNILRRMHLISRAMLENSLEAFFNNDDDLAEDVIGRDTEVDKFYLLVSRELTENVRKRSTIELNVTPEQSLQYLSIAKSYERIADHAVKIARICRKNVGEISGEMKEYINNLYKKTLETLELSSKSFFSLDEKASNEALNAEKDMEKLVSKVLENVDSMTFTIMVFTLIDSLQRVAGYSMDIAEGALNLKILEDE